MENKYFNTYETDQIFALKNTNPKLSIKKYEEYFKKYPYDYSTYCYYIDMLLALGKIDEAEKVINKIKKLVDNDENYSKNHERKILFDRHMHYVMIRLLFLKGEYEKTLEYKNENKKEIKNTSINAIYILCKKRLGTLDIPREKGFSYLHRQFIEYDEKEFLDHIKNHFIEHNNEQDYSYFSPDFPLLEVLEEIKKYIPSDKVLYEGFGDSNYYFKYDNCGRCNKKNNNFIKVVCIEGTNNIITMRPVDYGDDLPYVDLNYMVKEDNYEDLREKDDRIAKFYKRYNKK